MEGNVHITYEIIEAVKNCVLFSTPAEYAGLADHAAFEAGQENAISCVVKMLRKEAARPASPAGEAPPTETHVAGDALRILQEGIDGAEADMQSDADAGERVDLFDYEISLPYETAREIAALLRAVPPIPNFVGILQRIADEIAALKLHPITSEDYDAGYIGGRGDAFAIVDEALDALLVEPKPEPLLSIAEQKEQAKRCSCHGSDDYCPCQNVPDAETRRRRASLEGGEQ